MTDLAAEATAPDDATPAAADPGQKPARLPWDEIVKWSLIGSLVLVLLVAVDVSRHGGNNPVSLVQPGTLGPSAEAIAADFPDVQPPEGVGLDGQQYYAIARDPLHLDRAAEQLDNPRYRLQRPLLPWLAWAIHPTGGGLGLIYALLFIGLVAVFGGAMASGALSTMWRGPPWVAAVFPILPGAYWSLRVTVSDAMALALALAAVALAARSRHGLAVVVGVLAVLAKEPAILVFVGWALHRRTRKDAMLVVVPGLVVVAWMGWLGLQLPADPDRAQDIGLPFVGLARAWTDIWSNGRELVGMACTLGALAAGAAALWFRRLRHPLGWAIAIQVAFLAVMGVNPLSANFGATRMAMPVMMLSVIALATPRASET